MGVLTDVPEELAGHQIETAQRAPGFAISLDTAEPWGGGRILGRVEIRNGQRDSHPVTVGVRCCAAWLDVAPQLVGQKKLLSISTYWDIRTRAVPMWIEEEVFLERWEIGALDGSNWLHFELDLPPDLPRAVEGTFVAFRWRVEARRGRRIGHEKASLPLIVVESRDIPVVRVETTPLGSWRLLEWKSEGEVDSHAAQCSIEYAERRPEDMPPPGETRESEQKRMREAR